ncbi:MAG: DMT family transporter [Acidimicrobiales bacterium]
MTEAELDAEQAERARLLQIGLLSSFIAFALISLSPVIVAASGVHGMVMAFWRSLIGFVLLGMFVIPRRRLSWRAFVSTAPAGLAFGGAIGLFFWASQITSVVNASLITVFQPIVLMVAASLMFDEHMTRRDIFWAGAAISGAAVLILAGDSEGTGDIRGDLLAFVSIMIGAAYFVFGKQRMAVMALTDFMTGMFAWATLVLIVVVVASGEPILADNNADWIRIVAVGLAPGFGHVLINYAHGKAPLNLMGLMQLFVPVSATLLAYWFLDQSVTTFQVVGMVVVISALAVQTLTRPEPAPAVDEVAPPE